jgi:hypothetical protein
MVIEFKQAIGVHTEFKQKKSNRVGSHGKSCSFCNGACNAMLLFKLCLNSAIHDTKHGNTWQYQK